MRRLNGLADRHEAVCSDVLSYIGSVDTLPPVVILDPPAYAKSRANRHKAVKGYQRLNEAAMRKMPADSLLWTFSCSQVVDAQLFEDTIVSAAIRSGRTVRISAGSVNRPITPPSQAIPKPATSRDWSCMS